MTKENRPGADNIQRISPEYDLMINGEFDTFIKKVELVKKAYDEMVADGSEIDETIKNEFENITRFIENLSNEIASMKSLELEDNSIEFRTSSDERIYLNEWENKLQKLQKILAKQKKVRKNRTKPEASVSEITTTDSGTTEVAENESKKPAEVVDLITKPKKERIKYGSISFKITEYVDKISQGNLSEETEKEILNFIEIEREKINSIDKDKVAKKDISKVEGDLKLLEILERRLNEAKKSSKKDKKGKETLKDLSQLKTEKREVKEIKNESLKRYYEVISGFTISQEKRNESLAKRRPALIELKKTIVEDENGEQLINEGVSLIEDTINILKDLKIPGADTLITLLEGDIFEIKSARKQTESTEENQRDLTIEERIENYVSIREKVLEYKAILESEINATGKIKPNTRGKITKFIKNNKSNIKTLIQYIRTNGVKDGGRNLNILKKDNELIDKLERLSKGDLSVLNKTEEKPEPETTTTSTAETDNTKELDINKFEDAFEYLQSMTTAGREYSTIAKLDEDTRQWLKKSLGIITTPIEEKLTPEVKTNLIRLAKKIKSKLESKVDKKEEKTKTKIERKRWPRVGEFVMLKSEGKNQWEEYRKIKRIEKSETDGRFYAFFEGDTTGIPTEQLEILSSDSVKIDSKEDRPVTKIESDTFESPRASDVIIDIPGPEETGIGEVELDKIFTVESGIDYSEIIDNKDFNNWITNIYNSLKKDGRNNGFEVKDLKEWYRLYQESLPYYQKLTEIFKNENQEQGSEALRVLMMSSKINELMYDLYNNKPNIKEKIVSIYESYTARIQKEVEIKRLKELAALQTNISDAREIDSYNKDLKSDQVRRLLESRGRENTQENLNQLMDFLLNMKNNYTSYASGVRDERESENIAKIIKRFKDNPSGSEGARGGFRSIWSKIKPSNLWSKVDIDDLNRYAPIIEEVRKQNLVERIGRGDRKEVENASRMNKLLDLMRSRRDLIIKYIENPQSVSTEIAALEQEDKQIFDVFVVMYNKFSEQKYRTNEGKMMAERVLAQSTDISTLESSTSDKNEMFSGLSDEDLRKLEVKAVYENALMALDKIDQQITNFPKGLNGELAKNISDTFDTISSIFNTENSGASESDLLRLKKVKIKVSELVIRHTNKNSFKDIQSALSKYDTIFEAEEVQESTKIEYAKSLLEILKRHRANTQNTTFQNALLDNLIENYLKKV